jgi:hypothetical protein
VGTLEPGALEGGERFTVYPDNGTPYPEEVRAKKESAIPGEIPDLVIRLEGGLIRMIHGPASITTIELLTNTDDTGGYDGDEHRRIGDEEYVVDLYVLDGPVSDRARGEPFEPDLDEDAGPFECGKCQKTCDGERHSSYAGDICDECYGEDDNEELLVL